MPENPPVNPEKFEVEPDLVSLLAAIRYALFAEGDIIANNGVLRRYGALLPVREKNPEDEEGPFLGEEELEGRLFPFMPFGGESRDYRPIEKDPLITKDQLNEKFYSSAFHRRVRKTPEEVMGEEKFKEMNALQVEQWAYRQLRMLEKYSQSMDKLKPPTDKEVQDKAYSKRLTQKTGLSLQEMAGEDLAKMSSAEIEHWAQWELKGLENQSLYVRDFFKTIRKLKKIIQNGLMSLDDKVLNGVMDETLNSGHSNSAEQKEILDLKVVQKTRNRIQEAILARSEKRPKGLVAKIFAKQIKKQKEHEALKRKKIKRVKLEAFGRYVGDHEADEQREALSEAIEKSLIQELLSTHKGGYPDEETTKRVLKNDLTALSRVANDYYSFLRGKYFDKSHHVALNAEVENCHNIGHLFLMAFDAKNYIPKVRREAANKLILMILLSELENYSKQNNEAMEKMTNLLNERVFKFPGIKKGKTYSHYLFSRHNETGEVQSCEIRTEDRELEAGEQKEDLERRLFHREERLDDSVENHYVAMGNREKDLLQRLSKLIRENNTPGEQETDLNGFRFMVEHKEDQELLMNAILEVAQESFNEGAEKCLEKDVLDEQASMILEKLYYFNKGELNFSAMDEKEKPYILNLDPIPISSHKLKQLQSPGVIDALGQDVTQAPVFITEFKDTLDGNTPFKGGSASSSGKLRVLKYKLHVANPERPGEYDQYEMQYYLPEGYLNMQRDQDLRHKRYGIERVFERLAPLMFGEEIYKVDHLQAKERALKKEKEAA